MRPEIRFTPPRRARRRIAGLVMPWMLSRNTFLWRLAPPLPRPLPPLPRPDISSRLCRISLPRLLFLKSLAAGSAPKVRDVSDPARMLKNCNRGSRKPGFLVGSWDHLEWLDWTGPWGRGEEGANHFSRRQPEKGGLAAERRRERGRGKAGDLRGGCRKRGTDCDHSMCTRLPVPVAQIAGWMHSEGHFIVSVLLLYLFVFR